MFDPFYPFDWLATQIVTGLLGLSLESHLGASLHFFYDVPKVLTLLLTISFLVGTVQSFLQPEQVRFWLGGKRTLMGNIMAATVGIFTPFCSCSAVPLSFPEIVILRKVLEPQLLIVFIALVSVGIISIGYLFNSILI